MSASLSEQRFNTEKPSIHVGVVGQDGHGKSTLTVALNNVMAETYGGHPLDLDQLARMTTDTTMDGITFGSATVEYHSGGCKFLHTDYRQSGDLTEALRAGAPMEVALVVVSVVDDSTEQTREQIERCQQAGVRGVVLFLNGCDRVDDEELLELKEMESRELLTQYGYPGDDCASIRGSALGALQGDREWQAKLIELAGEVELVARSRQ
ncbi:GTP-binding protein [Sphaerotilus sp.]|uniref:GTP-binding protein n=1 Tax=Sphaerotilus sp. TaxID=2093942 RepID=UPI002ACF094B|nr:GTP-binding protein [Sphaerotilus sp.]MDZ7858571.1 GTP-binding protein [Sphaerotilus sp.]